METKLRRGQAKVEYLANLKEIRELRKAGHTVRHVYDMLFQKGKICMSYQRFYQLVRFGTMPRRRREKPRVAD